MQIRVWTLPNLITATRIPLAFVFGYAVWSKENLASWIWLSVALLAVILAMVSDYLDGYVARKLKMGSDVGKLFDPIADAFFFVTAFIALAIGGVIPWWLAAPFVVRELTQHLYVRPTALKRGVVMAAKFIGKLKTATQCVVAILVVLVEGLRLALGSEFADRLDLKNPLNWVNWVCVGVTGALSIASIAPYLRTLWALDEVDRSVVARVPEEREGVPIGSGAQNDASLL